jgi:hypothetical protein
LKHPVALSTQLRTLKTLKLKKKKCIYECKELTSVCTQDGELIVIMERNLCCNYLQIKYCLIVVSSSEPQHESENIIIHSLNGVIVAIYYFPWVILTWNFTHIHWLL